MSISLDSFDKEYFENIDGCEEIFYVDEGIYYTIFYNGQKV